MTQETSHVVARKKLIEVALPLDAINKASAREKSIRHGHPSTLHLWWSRKPLATARAVIFAQMVDDPSASPDIFRTAGAQEKERRRLFGIIEELVKWENTTNNKVLRAARDEIWQSWRRACAENINHPRANEFFNRRVLPAFLDPFAGGGSLPLEAQRLGLEAYASDLNPVAVLINRALIEIPPKFSGRAPMNPESTAEPRLMRNTWRGARGLAEDLRYYGRWIRDQANKRIGHLYPKVTVTPEAATGRPDLEPYVGRELTVIAWLWVRTVKSPNPAFAEVQVPLAPSYILSTKAGKQAYIEPVLNDRGYHFVVRDGPPPPEARQGTKLGRGANFKCILTGTPITGDYIKSEAQSGQMETRLKAIVAEGDRRRIFLSPSPEIERIAGQAFPRWKPDVEISGSSQYIGVRSYGMERFSHLFTDRQLVSLDTLCDLVADARDLIRQDAIDSGIGDDGLSLKQSGLSATAYAEAVATYLALAVSKASDSSCSIARWQSTGDKVAGVFARQAIPMMWDFAEVNPFSTSTQNWMAQIEWIAKALQRLPENGCRGEANQIDASSTPLGTVPSNLIISTDPPYFDNVPFADLSDFFYVWMRHLMQSTFPDLFTTLAVPKSEEIVAATHRHSSREDARGFFLDRMQKVLTSFAEPTFSMFPITIYYAFKQSDVPRRGTTKTAWETFLDAVIEAGLTITGTWPMRTERQGRSREIGSNALASSIVLVCRPRPCDVSSATRREFHDALRSEFPRALAELRRSNIAAVDLAQASIGPGMAVFTRYAEVLSADGSPMSVRDALGLINATLDEVFAEEEGDFDSDTRWALTWLEQYGFDDGDYGVAEQLSKAKNTSVDGLVRAGLVNSRRGSVRLLKPAELDPDWDPANDSRLTVWEMTHHLIRALESGGEPEASVLAVRIGSRADSARDLAYRLYAASDQKNRATDSLQYNSLVESWPEIVRLAGERRIASQQGVLALDLA